MLVWLSRALPAAVVPARRVSAARRRAHDAIAEIHQLSSRTYEWVLEGDIEACLDNIDHTALMDRVRRRVGDKGPVGDQGVPAWGHPR